MISFFFHSLKRGSKSWFPMKIGGEYGNGVLEIIPKHSTSLHVLNEEDIPHILLNSLTFHQILKGYETRVNLKLQNTVNDMGIREISQSVRKCVFPDEKFDTKYKRYSYSVCVTECLKKIQLKTCNCTHYNVIYDGKKILFIYKKCWLVEVKLSQTLKCDYINHLMCLYVIFIRIFIFI